MNVRLLTDIAAQARLIIESAEAAGVEIDDGNVVDLVADHITDVSLPDIRSALIIAGYSARFPKATSNLRDCLRDLQSKMTTEDK